MKNWGRKRNVSIMLLFLMLTLLQTDCRAGKKKEAAENVIGILQMEPGQEMDALSLTDSMEPEDAVEETSAEKMTESETEKTSEAETESATEGQTEPVTEGQTEPITEAETEPVTEPAPTLLSLSFSGINKVYDGTCTVPEAAREQAQLKWTFEGEFPEKVWEHLVFDWSEAAYETEGAAETVAVGPVYVCWDGKENELSRQIELPEQITGTGSIQKRSLAVQLPSGKAVYGDFDPEHGMDLFQEEITCGNVRKENEEVLLFTKQYIAALLEKQAPETAEEMRARMLETILDRTEELQSVKLVLQKEAFDLDSWPYLYPGKKKQLLQIRTEDERAMEGLFGPDFSVQVKKGPVRIENRTDFGLNALKPDPSIFRKGMPGEAGGSVYWTKKELSFQILTPPDAKQNWPQLYDTLRMICSGRKDAPEEVLKKEGQAKLSFFLESSRNPDWKTNETKTIEVGLDADPPKIRMEQGDTLISTVPLGAEEQEQEFSSGMEQTSAGITILAEDDKSGLRRVTYCYRNKPDGTMCSQGTLLELSDGEEPVKRLRQEVPLPQKDGSYVLEVFAEDLLGSRTDVTSTEIRKDTTAPMISDFRLSGRRGGKEGIFTGDVKVSFSLQDPGAFSGIGKIQFFCEDGGSTQLLFEEEGSGKASETVSVTIPARTTAHPEGYEGNAINFYAIVWDRAGNDVQRYAENPIAIDMTPPRITISDFRRPDQDGCTDYQEKVSCEVNLQDRNPDPETVWLTVNQTRVSVRELIAGKVSGIRAIWKNDEQTVLKMTFGCGNNQVFIYKNMQILCEDRARRSSRESIPDLVVDRKDPVVTLTQEGFGSVFRKEEVQVLLTLEEERPDLKQSTCSFEFFGEYRDFCTVSIQALLDGTLLSRGISAQVVKRRPEEKTMQIRICMGENCPGGYRIGSVICRDHAGRTNQSEKRDKSLRNTFVVDQTPPKVTGSIRTEKPEHGIYAGDVVLEISGTDPSSGEMVSGIDRITYEVWNKDTLTQKGTIRRQGEENELQGKLIVEAEKNEGESICVLLRSFDRAGNRSKTRRISLKIDTTPPRIRASIDGEPVQKNYFSKSRTMTVSFEDRNLDMDRIFLDADQRNLPVREILEGKWKHLGILAKWEKKGKTPVLRITFGQKDGTVFDHRYQKIGIRCEDLAGNRNLPCTIEGTAAETFVIDATKPVIRVTYEDDGAQNGLYYASARTAVVAIEETNFDPDQVVWKIESDNGAMPERTGRNDQKVILTFQEDGAYDFSLQVTDPSGNTAVYRSEHFVIDQTPPRVRIWCRDDGGTLFVPGRKGDEACFRQGSAVVSVEIQEKNLEPNRQGVIWKNGGADIPAVFSSVGILHRTEKRFSADGSYALLLSVTDLAGNPAEEVPEMYFTLDNEKPEEGSIEVDGRVQKGDSGDAVLFCRKEALSFQISGRDAGSGPPEIFWYLSDHLLAAAELAGADWNVGNQGFFAEEGEWILYGMLKDRAGNIRYLNTGRIILDRTAPVITADLESPPYQIRFEEKYRQNCMYFSSAFSAGAVIREPHFSSEQVLVSCKKDGVHQDLPFSVETISEGVFRVWMEFSEDGWYELEITCRDQAENEAELKWDAVFVLDQKKPEIRILGIDPANREKAAAVIEIRDASYDPEQVQILLSGTRKEHPETEAELDHKEKTENGERFYLKDFPYEREADDRYILRAACRDKAGNPGGEVQKTFTVNRFGSVYELSPDLEEIAAQYYTCLPQEADLTVYEYNVDLLTEKICLTDREKTRELQEGEDYTLTQDMQQGMNRFSYHFPDRLFEQDGVYTLNLYSRDAAGNRSSSQRQGLSISLAADRTPPSLVIAGISEGKEMSDPYYGTIADVGIYPVPELYVTLDAKDNLQLKTMKIRIESEKAGKLEQIESRDIGPEELAEKNGIEELFFRKNPGRQYAEILVEDAAGNQETVRFRLRVNTGIWTFWISNPSLLYAVLAALAAVLFLTVLFILTRASARRRSADAS